MKKYRIFTKSGLKQLLKVMNGEHPVSTYCGKKYLPLQLTREAEEGAQSHKMNTSGEGEEKRVALSLVVEDCAKRWFQDTLKEAKSGDLTMQVLVAQMYYSGYGVTRDSNKGRLWITRASKRRSSVWKVSDKHPGYNASDSDSDELKMVGS